MDEPARSKIKRFFRREDAFSGFPFLPYLPSPTPFFKVLQGVDNRTSNERCHRPISFSFTYVYLMLVVLFCVILTGSLVGHLLPRVMLHERGIAVSSVKFGKTESNKPYICTVRYVFLPSLGVGLHSESYTIFLFDMGHVFRDFLTPGIPLSNRSHPGHGGTRSD